MGTTYQDQHGQESSKEPASDSTAKSALQLRLASLMSRRAQSRDVQRALGRGQPSDGLDVHRTAQAGLQGSGGALPFGAQIQASFGRHDISGIRAHVGGPAEQAARDLGAEAYATGDAVAFAGAPCLHTAAHEAAHVVQQRGGVQLRGGIGAPGDRYEQHADAVADLVVAGRSAEALLDDFAGSGPSAGAVQSRAVQLDPRDEARDQHDKRNEDTPDSEPHSVYAAYAEHDGERPEIAHDHGFLDDGNGNIDESRRRDPTISDHLARLKWIAKLEAAEALRPDLVDGTSAYRHFLFGNGRQRTIDYQRFIDGDSSGARVWQSVLEDARYAAIDHHDRLIGDTPRAGTWTFQLRTDRVGVGNDGRYPYPATENWQKAIGGHSIWTEMTVTVEMEALTPASTETPGEAEGEAEPAVDYVRRFEVNLTLHMEDMYNFNPGQEDIASGIPDDDNGRFEITGLGHEYLHVARLERGFSFETDLAQAVRAPGVEGLEVDRGGSSGPPDDSRGRSTAR